MLGFTLKKGSTIAINNFNAGYYCVKLVSDWVTYHCIGEPTKTVFPETVLVPPMYVNASAFKRTLMDLMW